MSSLSGYDAAESLLAFWAEAGVDATVTARARPREAAVPAARLTPVTGTG